MYTWEVVSCKVVHSSTSNNYEEVCCRWEFLPLFDSWWQLQRLMHTWKTDSTLGTVSGTVTSLSGPGHYGIVDEGQECT